MRKSLFVFLLSALMVLNSLLPVGVYAKAAISEEGEICTRLGILKGHTGVVDAAYLGTRPTRLQAAVMFLRLKGLEERALEYDWDVNFGDAGTVAWKQGQNVLGYLKAHPELGWIGDGTYFRPSEPLNAQAYYKVLLEALGYKQILDGAGDFSWSSVLTFAKGKGLEKAAKDSYFTVNSLAVATVEALKIKLKNSNIRLIDRLIEEGVVDQYAAEDYGLYHSGINTDIKAVRAISGSRVEIEFDSEVNGDAAEDEDLYAIEQGSTDLPINGARMKNDSTLVLEVAGLKEGYSYTLEADGRSFDFKGVKKNTGAPELVSVVCKDSSRLELHFDRVLDHVSAQDTGTYTISGVTVKSAELDASNTMVRLAVEGIQSHKSYDLKVSSLKNGDGVLKKTMTKRFSGFKDTTAPKADTLTALTNTRLRLSFSDKNGLGERSAEDRDNYRITWEGGTLEVQSVRVMDLDHDGLLDTVELTTDEQISGEDYVLRVIGIEDDSDARNRISKEIRKEFRGKRKDTGSPTVAKNPVVISNDKLEIVFDDASAMDIDSLTDLNNYEFNDGLEAIRAELKDSYDLYAAAGKTVVLTTTEMEKSESYYITISGILDEFGNEIKASSGSSYKKYRFSGRAADRTPPYVVSLNCSGNREIQLNFDDRLDKVSAENIRNYRIDGLFLVTEARLADNEKTVILETGYLSEEEQHTVQLNGIKDLAGNAMSDIKVYVEVDDGYDDGEPAEVDYIEAVNEDEIWVHFEEKVRVTGLARLKAGGFTFSQAEGTSLLEEGTTVVLKAASPMQDRTYEVTSIENIRDYYNNRNVVFEEDLEFEGTTEENDPPEVDDWDQYNIRTFRVTFSEPVLLKEDFENGIRDPKGSGLGWEAEIDPEDEEDDEGYSTVDFIADKEIPADREYYFDFTKMVVDYAGRAAMDEDDTDGNTSKATVLEAYLEDDEEPYLEYAEALSRTKVQLVFNEELSRPGSYKITYYDDNGRDKTLDIKHVEVDADDKEKVNIYTDDLMDGDTYYTLIALTGAVDLAGNKMDPDDEEYEFEGTDIVSVDYIQGIQVIDEKTVRVTKSSRIDSVKSIVEVDSDGDVISDNLMSGTVDRISDTRYEVEVKVPLLEALYYKVNVDDLSYSFRGVVEDNDISVDGATGRIEYDDQDEAEQEVKVQKADGTALDVEFRNGHFYIENTSRLKNGDKLYVTVLDEYDGIVLYGAKVTVQGVVSASLSSEKRLTSFKFTRFEPDAVGIINESSKTVKLTVPYGTDITRLAATFSSSPESTVLIGSKKQYSGETVNDFTYPIVYTVVAENGSETDYTVTVSVANANNIQSVEFVDAKCIRVTKSSRINQVESVVEVDASGNAVSRNLIAGTPIRLSDTRFEVDVRRPLLKELAYNITVDGLTHRFRGTVEDYGIAVNGTTRKITWQDQNTRDQEAVAERQDGTRLQVNLRNGYYYIDASEDLNNGDVLYAYVVRKSDEVVLHGSKLVLSEVANLSSEQEITHFGFRGLNPVAAGQINQENRTIKLLVPAETVVTNLVATFVSSENTQVWVGNVLQRSGITPNDFTNPVTYTVIAEDGSRQNYAVTVEKAGSSQKQLLEFGFAAPAVWGIINQETGAIAVTVPYGTDITNLAAVFRVTENTAVYAGESVQTSGVTPNNFTVPVVYKVKAQDGSSGSYTVTVTVAGEGDKAITRLGFCDLQPNVWGRITEQWGNAILVTVPWRTDITKLRATFDFVGKSVEVNGKEQISGETVNDFRKPVTYTVIGYDGARKNYRVTVRKGQ